MSPSKPPPLRALRACLHLRTIPLLLLATWLAGPACTETFDLRPHWNTNTPLANPHKGWYHHFPDNHIDKYRIAEDADLLEFPGMDHVYIRLAWAYLHPEEERFDWEVIDTIIRKWTAHGLGIAFRISCRETGNDRIEQQYATPLWVVEAGARGGHYLRGKATGPDGPWEPDFADPVFLEKLEVFLLAFGQRYDGQPWLRYVDVGSIGDWGEGHTHSGSRKEYGYDIRKRHIDLYRQAFRQTQLVVTDDFVYAVSDPEDRKRLHDYVRQTGLTYRDDSILVNGYLAGTSRTFTVRSPGFFADLYLRHPTILELEHYRNVKSLGNWEGTEGSSLARYGGGRSGADYFRGALDLLHASYLGYHGDARQWLTDNPDLTIELLNRCGYYYLLHRIEFPAAIRAGSTHTLTALWENRGAAPAYHPYALKLRLRGKVTLETQCDSGNLRWLPATPPPQYAEQYSLAVPSSLPPGPYALQLQLSSETARRPILLALDPNRLDEDQFYRIGTVQISE